MNKLWHTIYLPDKGLSMRQLFCASLFLLSSTLMAQTREIAITIDDLPLVASKMNTPANQERSIERFTKIVNAFVQYKVPATGFVIAGSIQKGQWAFLEQFKAAGLMLGNHTNSHYNLNAMSAPQYIADVDKADKKLQDLFTQPKYFRYPYLAEGTKQTKPLVLDYLREHGYTVAPVTIDSKDFQFNESVYKVPYRAREQYIQKLKPKYLAYIWKQTLNAEKKSAQGKQILLLHANLLNSYLLGDILEMYQKNGYTFISLSDALKDPAPVLKFPGAETTPPSALQPLSSK